MSAQATDLKPWEYMDSLGLTEKPTEVYGLDGGALWRVDDEHFVMLVCTAEHEGNPPSHRGPAMLLRVLPQDWACFATFVNPVDDFEAHHYGPARTEPDAH